MNYRLLHDPVRLILRAVRHIARMGFEEAGYWYGLLADRSMKAAHWSGTVEGTYLITTDRGVFLLTGSTVRRISRLPAFGIAISEDQQIYLATWGPGRTTIVTAPLERVLAAKIRCWREIWQLPIANFAARVHQISACENSLWLANTAENSLTRLDRKTGAWQATVAPFACSFGHPIQTDHNHVNGVLARQNYVVFSAFKINRQAAFGVFGDGKLWLFSYPNMGVHDCVFDGTEFLFCDSYCFWQPQTHGALYRAGENVFEDFFREAEASFLRGIAGNGSETLVGNSYGGDRTKRFTGKCQVFVLRNTDQTPQRLELPAAQVYDIIRTDGEHFERSPANRTASEVAENFEAIFGPPVLVTELRDTLSGEHQKRFDLRDVGHVEEYLITQKAPRDGGVDPVDTLPERSATC